MGDKIEIVGEEKLSAEDQAFNFQIEMLKKEIDQIQGVITNIDGMTQQIKNWTILIWAGSISLIIGNTNQELRKLIWISVIIPILFWVLDASMRHRQRKFIFRSKKISEYLNSEKIRDSFKEKRLLEYSLFDIKGLSHDKEERRIFIDIRKTIRFTSLKILYLGLIIITVVLQAILYPMDLKPISHTDPFQTNDEGLNGKDKVQIINEIKILEIKIDSLKNLSSPAPHPSK